MSKHFPLTFSLEDGIHVVVNRTGDKSYAFSLTPKEGPTRYFDFIEEDPRDKNIDALDFDQLNAVRRMWLEQEKMHED